MSSKKILILIIIHSCSGATLAKALTIKKSLEDGRAIIATIKRVPTFAFSPPVSKAVQDIAIATIDELAVYDAILFGSPVYFYSPAAEMMAFLQGGMSLWEQRALFHKPAGVFFTSNGNGDNFAADALRSTLRSLYMDTDTLKDAFPNALDGACLDAIMKRNSSYTSVSLPQVPEPVGLYKPYKITGNLIFINQIALKDGKIEYPGVIGIDLNEDQAKTATKDAMLNVLAVLSRALSGNLSRVKQMVEISGFFNAQPGYHAHSLLLNEASKIAIEILGEEKGAHTRASFGVSSLPMNSPVEIKAIVEISSE